MDIPDSDLVQLARDGDPAAFRLLVERHQPMARTRAARLCPRPDDVDDTVQDAFLQAFIALDRLRDPARFAGWLSGIVTNICRAQSHRTRGHRAPPTLLGDWPEQLHPASVHGLPSAEDLDRADALDRALADLPPGQRQAVTLFYYADRPASQIPGSAKANLHHARRRLREYITAHRPDLIPDASRRTPMTSVRIAHADPWPGRTADGGMSVAHVLVVLADDGGPSADHRALAIRLNARDGRFWRLLEQRDHDEEEEEEPEEHAEEMTGQLLQAAGIRVAGVTITDLGPGVTAARIELGTPRGTRQVTARLADGLALVAITGAPLAVDGPVMDRLAEPVTGPDLLGPFRSRQQAGAWPPPHRRFEPRNLTFADGLDGWRLSGSFQREGIGLHDQDYSAVTEDQRAILAAAVPEPAGSAVLIQTILADDYRGAAVTFRGDLRATDVQDRAGLVLRVAGEEQFRRPGRPEPEPRHDPDNHFAPVTGSRDWSRQEVTALIPPDAVFINFGAFLSGRGQIELRNAELESTPGMA
jgi:RNA polymerase sigma factor (sigma-70 family)